jgi:glycosyltransferase involved in cell wall biosynthesis
MADLTVGMATYDDFSGVYFTVQSLRLYHPNLNIEIAVVDNYGCKDTEDFITNWVPNGKYILDRKIQGTAYPKNRVFQFASSPYVLCLDSHVLLVPQALENLICYFQANPDTGDLLHGPMYYDNLKETATHMDPVWRGEMFGIWAYDTRVEAGTPFEIPMHGMGLFACRKDRWLGFHPRFRGFGGEEGYIHEKFRQAGRKILCLPWLGWVHRFYKSAVVKYSLTREDKLINYFLGHIELGLDLQPIRDHFQEAYRNYGFNSRDASSRVDSIELQARRELVK